MSVRPLKGVLIAYGPIVAKGKDIYNKQKSSEFPDFWGTRLSMSEVCWRSGEPLEGEQTNISQPVVARVPRRNVKEFWITILSEAKRPQM